MKIVAKEKDATSKSNCAQKYDYVRFMGLPIFYVFKGYKRVIARKTTFLKIDITQQL